jgi:hypothetical protein
MGSNFSQQVALTSHSHLENTQNPKVEASNTYKLHFHTNIVKYDHIW